MLDKKQVNIDSHGYGGLTAMHQAVYNFVLISIFIREFNATVNTVNDAGVSPLDLAIIKHYDSSVNFLLVRGATLTRAANPPLLQLAVEKSTFSILKLLLKKGASLDAQDVNGDTALHVAIRKRFTKIAVYLINKSANLDTMNLAGETPR